LPERNQEPPFLYPDFISVIPLLPKMFMSLDAAFRKLRIPPGQLKRSEKVHLDSVSAGMAGALGEQITRRVAPGKQCAKKPGRQPAQNLQAAAD
jgi:hypothetical protein